MIKLKDILFEDEKNDKNAPNKILVINKKTREQYYIDKQNFDPDIHDRTDKVVVGKKDKEDEKSDDKKDSKEKESPKEQQPATPISFINQSHQDKIVEKIPQIRPDLFRQLVSYNFSEWFPVYDAVIEKSYAKKSDDMEEVKDIATRSHAVSLAKFIAMSKDKPNEFAITAGKQYRKNAKKINSFLRGNTDGISKEEMMGLQKIMSELDKYFSSNESELQFDCQTYKSVSEEVIDKFVSAKKWTDKSYVSTSLNPFIGESYELGEKFSAPMRNPLFQFNLKKGDPVLMIPCSEDVNCSETDITLPRNCKFRITSFNEKNNVYIVSVEFPNATI